MKTRWVWIFTFVLAISARIASSQKTDASDGAQYIYKSRETKSQYLFDAQGKPLGSGVKKKGRVHFSVKKKARHEKATIRPGKRRPEEHSAGEATTKKLAGPNNADGTAPAAGTPSDAAAKPGEGQPQAGATPSPEPPPASSGESEQSGSDSGSPDEPNSTE